MFRIVDFKIHKGCVLVKKCSGDKTGIYVPVLDELKVLDTKDGVEEWISYFDFCEILPSILKDLEPLEGTSKESLLVWAKYVRRVSWRYDNNRDLYIKTGGYFDAFIRKHIKWE